jgi:hypothetical protein
MDNPIDTKDMRGFIYELYRIRDEALDGHNDKLVQSISRQIDKIWELDVTRYDRFEYIIHHWHRIGVSRELKTKDPITIYDVEEFKTYADTRKMSLAQVREDRENEIKKWLVLREYLSQKIVERWKTKYIKVMKELWSRQKIDSY